MSIPYYSYVYRISHIQDSIHYYGSRYCLMESRFSEDPLEDLKQYQTSSSNTEFKQELEQYPERFKFKIIKTFDHPHKALSLESKLHYKFDVVNNFKFYNKSNQKPPKGESIYDGIELYDLEKDCSFIVESMRGSYNQGLNFYDLCLSTERMVYDNRYCLIDDNLDYYKEQYRLSHRIVTLYKYNDVDDIVDSMDILVKDCAGTFGAGRVQRLLNGQMRKMYDYYIDKSLCEYDNQYFTIYQYDFKTNTANSIRLKRLESMAVIGRDGRKLLDGKTKYIRDYYMDKDLCIRHNTPICLFEYVSGRVVKHMVTKRTCFQILGFSLIDEYINNVMYRRIDKYYKTYDECLNNHKI